MSDTERDKYLDWMREKIQKEISFAETERNASGLLSAKDYLGSLKSLELTSVDKVNTFLATTQSLFVGSAVEHIPLGKNGQTRYVLQSQICPLDIKEKIASTGESKGLHPYILSFQSPGKSITERSTLNYGLYLGSLLFSDSEKDSVFKETNYHVILNALDHSIWIILDYSPYDDMGDRYEIETQGIPSPVSLQASKFDTLQLFDGDAVKKGLPNTFDHVLFDPGMLKEARIEELDVFMEQASIVEAAIQASHLASSTVVVDKTSASSPSSQVPSPGVPLSNSKPNQPKPSVITPRGGALAPTQKPPRSA